MLNTYRMSRLTKAFLTSRVSYLLATKSKLIDLKNNSVALIQPLQQNLPYMSEIELENLNKGIVLKIQQNGTTYLGMYHEINPSNITPQTFNIKNIHKNWKSSSKQLQQNILKNIKTSYGIYDVDCKLIESTTKSTEQKQSNQQQKYELTNGNKRRLKSSSPILNLSYDLYYGDMISFLGCRGSKKSENSWSIAKQFTAENQNNLSIYVNPFIQEVKQFNKICPNSVSFTVSKNQKLTDAGVYMLTLKAISLAVQLKNKGKNVLLILDNLTNIMVRQWNLLQAIKFNSKAVDTSKLFQYNSLKIPPISILNEVYSNCQDNDPKKTLAAKKQSKGSLTSILIAENQNNQLVQQITTFSNNIKHLQTLSKVIEFPLNFKVNTNLFYKKPANEQEFQKIRQQKGFEEKDLLRFLRSYVNKYLNEKKETELRRQLYKNQIRDAPWDYFFILDAQWCTKGIKQMSPALSSFKESNIFLRWIIYNIQNDLLGNWSISAKESFMKLVGYLKNQQGLAETASLSEVSFSEQQIESFIDDCRMQGVVSPFKKDYLI